MYQKIIIIGAPRSGTNMLRDLLVKLDGVQTWPCDEINYIWRHHNKSYPSDEFTSEMASLKTRDFINNEFNKFAQKTLSEIVVEKTCANSMRVGFVNRVLPEAKYIFIVRDGFDVIGSAMLRWKAPLDIPYLLKKARYVPPLDLPYYASRYLGSHIHKFFSKEKRLSFWGPQMNDMETLLQKYSLLQVCGLQWKCCVENSEKDFFNIPSEQIIRVKYENFVTDPVHELSKLIQFIGYKNISNNDLISLTETVSRKSLGKGKDGLNDEEIASLMPLIGYTLEKHGYR